MSLFYIGLMVFRVEGVSGRRLGNVSHLGAQKEELLGDREPNEEADPSLKPPVLCCFGRG